MNAKVRWILLPLLASSLLTYVCLQSLPPGLANPYLFRFEGALLNVAIATGVLGHALGVGKGMEIFNKVSMLQYSFFMDSHSELEVKPAEFDGVPVVIYRPLTAVMGTLPAVVYFHGGGFSVMSTLHSDPVTSAMARDTPAVVVSVDYRLAPQHPYPAALDDCYAVTRYVIQHAGELHIDPARVAVAGSSAGGNLAAAVALRFRDNEELERPKLQLLVEPFLQAFDMRLPSYQQHCEWSTPGHIMALSLVHYMGDDRFLDHLELPPELNLIANNSHTSIEMRRAYGHIFDLDLIPEGMRLGHELQDTVESANEALVARYSPIILDHHAFPLMADSLEDLPPAFIMTSEFDTLRDDGILYAKHLEKSGVPVTWYHSLDTFHGGFNFIGSAVHVDTAWRNVKTMLAFFRENL